MKNISNVKNFMIKVIILLILYFSFTSVINPTLAQYFPTVPPTSIIVRETPIIVSYTQPQRVITIDVTQFDPNQVVKKITITLKESVFTVSLKIDLLIDRPQEVPEPKGIALLYFTSRAPREFLEKTERAVITFTVARDVVEEKRVNVETITLNRFIEGAWQELPTKKVDEDEKFLYFEAEAAGMFHFAATGVVKSPPIILIMYSDSTVMAAVVIAFMVAFMLGIYLKWW